MKRLTRWRERPGVHRDEALRHWQTAHAALVARVPGVSQYVQGICLAGPDRSEPPWAGVGEVRFADVDAAESALASSEWRAVMEDAAEFMDLEHVSAVWVEERTVLGR